MACPVEITAGGRIDRSFRVLVAVVDLADISREAVARQPGGVAVVAVDGPGGSGKSTLARRLAACAIGADVQIVEIDEFLSWPDPIGSTWWPRFEEQVLRPLFAGPPLHYQTRDWAGDEFGTSLGEWRHVPPSDLVIVEGIGSARSSVRTRAALTIWVEANAATRLRRGLERDGDDHRQLWLDSMKTEASHFAVDRTRENVDLRVNGDPSDEHDPATQIVTAT